MADQNPKYKRLVRQGVRLRETCTAFRKGRYHCRTPRLPGDRAGDSLVQSFEVGPQRKVSQRGVGYVNGAG